MRKMTRRVLGLVLALVMVISQFSGAGTVLADEQSSEGTWVATEYFTNGDFQTGDKTGWSINFTSWEGAGYKIEPNQWASNQTTFLNYWNNTVAGNTLTISQTLSAIPAGTYRVSFDQEGEAMSSGLSVSVADVEKELPATIGWDVWTTVTTDSFTLTEASDVTVTISGDLPAGYWGDFDNFVLEQYVVEEPEQPSEVLKLEVLDSTFEGELWKDGIWSVNPKSWTNASFEYFTYSENEWIKPGENQGTTAFKFWSQNAQNVTMTQTVDIPAGTYKVSSDFMGEKGSVQVVFGGQQGTAVAMSEFNAWIETNDTFTVAEDIKGATIGFNLLLEDGGYGYIDSISVTKVESTDEDDTKDEDVKDEEVVDPYTFTASDSNYIVAVTVDNLAPKAGDTVNMTAKVTTADGTEVTDLKNVGNLWWWSDKWMSGHENALMDAEYEKDANGYALTAKVTLPSVGTYYIIGELEYSGTKLPVVIPMTTTEPEVEEEDTYITGELNVEKIKDLPEDFIMGMDISSIISEFESGVTYKDFEGNTISNITDFCKFIAANGITHVRVRVWNNPYDADGNGYGGGNCDVATAAKIAEGCRVAGIKMLIDFHCSDLWADPGKQQAPKAWKDYTLSEKATAVEEFIGSALKTIDPNCDTVDMVQVGNETTGSFVGVSGAEDMSKLFIAGATAIRNYNENVKVVIHVTNPEKYNVTRWAANLDTYEVDYDVLATSYYPYWHGTLANLESQLKTVKETYGKDVMVAETSYAYTLEDSDGHANTVRVGNNDNCEDALQPFTVQGQATAIRDVMATVNNAGGLGVFYWESAWITVGDTTGLTGDAYDARVEANKAIWEEHGSGWASSYAAEYDATDAGKWYGGSAVDNEAMFYPDGTPTAALYVWNYVKTGAVSKYVTVENIVNPETIIDANAAITLPETVTVTYNSGDVEEAVVWNTEEVEAIDTAVAGTYKVNGTVTLSKEVNSGTYASQTTAAVVYTITVKQPNLITDADAAGFESGADYTIGGKGISSIPAGDDPYSGSGSMHWYNTSATTGTVTYNKVFTLEAGTYGAEIKTQGYAGDKVSLQILSASDEVLFEGEATVLEGWAVWKTATVAFELTETTDVKLRVVVDMQEKGWGTADELYLYEVAKASSNTGSSNNSSNNAGNVSSTTTPVTTPTTVTSTDTNVTEVVESIETTANENVVNETVEEIAEEVAVEEVVEETVKESETVVESDKAETETGSTEVEILEDEVPLAANAGGDIPMWPVLVATVVFVAFAGLYVFAKQRKMIK